MIQSMKDPKIANFWLITMPQVLGGVNFDEDEKKKIWWRYKVSKHKISHWVFKHIYHLFFINAMSPWMILANSIAMGCIFAILHILILYGY